LTLLVVVLAVVVLGNQAHSAPARTYNILTIDLRLNHVAVVSDSYTTGTREGGLGPRSWTARAWQILDSEGERIAPDVAAEKRAGYAMPGDHHSIFLDLTARAVKDDDALVVFFGSRNDEGVDPQLVAAKARDTFGLAHTRAPLARLLVIGPAWPTADVPDSILRIRDVLFGAALGAGAAWIDPIAERWFVGRPELIGADGVHPTDAGHQYLADMIAPLIRAQLST
jgi:hypothetical protein